MQAANSSSDSSVDTAIDLEGFLPYRLSVLSNMVSSAIAGAYSERFGLTIPEWRIIAVLGRFPGLSAREVADKTAMDKVAVSRAVSRLRGAQLLHHATAPQDRRRSILSLSEKGRALLGQVAPLALDYEARLLDGFSVADRQRLAVALLKLQERAREIGPLQESQAPSSVRTE